MSSQRALLTGATGFVGSHLADALRSSGHAVRAVVRATSAVERLRAAGVDVVVADLTDPHALAPLVSDIDVVYHLAAATRARGAHEYARANVATTAAIMEAVADAARPPRVVFLGSLASVGPTPDGQPVDEDTPPAPLTAYGRTKLEAEGVVLRNEDVPSVVLRAPAVYGPRDRDLFTFFRAARLGLMPVPAGPDRPVQMIHVSDLVRALTDAGASPAAKGVYHVAEPAIRPWSAVVEMIGDAVGRAPVRVPVPRSLLWAAAVLSEAGARAAGRATIFNRDKVRELLAAGWITRTERAERDLGFRAAIPLERGIAETADWYRSQGWLS